MPKQTRKPQNIDAPLDFRIKILGYLQTDASKTQKEVAGVLSMDPTTYSRHLERIESEGWIIRYVAVLNPSRFGTTTVAFVQFKLNDSREGPTNNLVELLCALPEIQEVHSVNGDYDLLAKVRVSNTDEVLRLVYRIEALDENIIDTSTSFTFCAHKETLELKCV